MSSRRAGSEIAEEGRTDIRLWLEDMKARDRVHADTIFNGKED